MVLVILSISGMGLECSCGMPGKNTASRINRIEQGLVLGAGTVVVGRPIPVASLAERMEAYRIPGASIAVINDFKLEWARGYGIKDKVNKIPVDTDTIFQAASISKPVAAASVLSLIEKGELDLNEDVNKYLSSWKVPENEFTRNRKVTLKGLLSHSAGLTVHGFRGYSQEEDVPQLQQILKGEKPANSDAIRVDIEPGSKWRYSGGGYTVMQQVLVDQIGDPFPQIISKLVLRPLGLINSTYEQPLPEVRKSSAAAAFRMNGKPVKGGWHIYPEMAAAGLWTTPSDLCRFALEIMQAFNGRSQKLFLQSTAEKMLTIVAGNYGLGFSLSQEGGELSFSHGGSNEGYKCILIAWPGVGQGAVIMTNSDYGSDLIQEILRSLAMEYDWPRFFPQKKTVVSLSQAELRAVAGSYQMIPGGALNIELENGRLYADSLFVVPGGKKRIEIFPENALSFFAIAAQAKFSFEKDSKGNVTGLSLDLIRSKRRGKKNIIEQ